MYRVMIYVSYDIYISYDDTSIYDTLDVLMMTECRVICLSWQILWLSLMTDMMYHQMILMFQQAVNVSTLKLRRDIVSIILCRINNRTKINNWKAHSKRMCQHFIYFCYYFLVLCKLGANDYNGVTNFPLNICIF